jgi:hypothetical protein
MAAATSKPAAADKGGKSKPPKDKGKSKAPKAAPGGPELLVTRRHPTPLVYSESLPDVDLAAGDPLGALAIDVGTGEMKLLAVMLRPRVELHELALVKITATEAAAALAEDDASLCEAICTQLTDSLAKLPALAETTSPAVSFEHALLGATAWYRQLPKYNRVKADALLSAVAARVQVCLVA